MSRLSRVLKDRFNSNVEDEVKEEKKYIVNLRLMRCFRHATQYQGAHRRYLKDTVDDGITRIVEMQKRHVDVTKQPQRHKQQSANPTLRFTTSIGRQVTREKSPRGAKASWSCGLLTADLQRS